MSPVLRRAGSLMFFSESGSDSIARNTDCHTSSWVAQRKLEYHLNSPRCFKN